jgi:hypothetical protein
LTIKKTKFSKIGGVKTPPPLVTRPGITKWVELILSLRKTLRITKISFLPIRIRTLQIQKSEVFPTHRFSLITLFLLLYIHSGWFIQKLEKTSILLPSDYAKKEEEMVRSFTFVLFLRKGSWCERLCWLNNWCYEYMHIFFLFPEYSFSIKWIITGNTVLIKTKWDIQSD